MPHLYLDYSWVQDAAESTPSMGFGVAVDSPSVQSASAQRHVVAPLWSMGLSLPLVAHRDVFAISPVEGVTVGVPVAAGRYL